MRVGKYLGSICSYFLGQLIWFSLMSSPGYKDLGLTSKTVLNLMSSSGTWHQAKTDELAQFIGLSRKLNIWANAGILHALVLSLEIAHSVSWIWILNREGPRSIYYIAWFIFKVFAVEYLILIPPLHYTTTAGRIKTVISPSDLYSNKFKNAIIYPANRLPIGFPVPAICGRKIDQILLKLQKKRRPSSSLT